MTNATHTPSPWKYEPAYLESSKVRDSKGNAININDEANARLIAAAPELLEALEDIQRSLDFSTNGGKSRNRFECELLKVANAAIAKAKGE